MYDFHLHSDFSMDSKAAMEDMVLSAIEKNMKSICFTDHIDLESTEQKLDFYFRTSDYFRQINRVKYKYRNQIQILAGVEIGLQPHLVDRYEEILSTNPFDFVIGSIHSVNGKDIFLDNYVEGLDPLLALEDYYIAMYDSIKAFTNYDVLGHIDFIDRYFNDFSTIPKFDEYQAIIIEILKLLIENGKGIDLNTSGIKYGLGYSHPKVPILKLYKALGGEIITIGSDAHTPEYVGYYYREVERIIKDLGFKYIHIFKDRKKIPIKI